MRNYNYNLTNVVLRIAENRVYYFDQSGVYTSMPLGEVSANKQIKIHLFKIFGETCWDRYSNFSLIFGNLNQKTLESMICRFPEGGTIETFYEELENIEDIKDTRKRRSIERFVTKIDRPMFIRDPENDRKNTFDFILIDVNIVTEWDQDRMQYIKDNKDEIVYMVLSKLENSSTFKKYGIPINFLKLSSITPRLKCNYIQFVFELKKLSCSEYLKR